MFYVYVIKSISFDNQVYVGFSSNLKQRIDEHNAGKSIYTKKFKPWKLMYYEAYLEESLARDRELKLKQRGKNIQCLKKRLGI